MPASGTAHGPGTNCMPADAFLDTNVIVYAVDSSEQEAEKRERALHLLEEKHFGLSAQVLQEFYVTVTRKIAVPLAPAVALEWIEQLEVFSCVATDSALVKVAAEISERYRISILGRRRCRCCRIPGRGNTLQRRSESRTAFRLRSGRQSFSNALKASSGSGGRTNPFAANGSIPRSACP